MERNTWRHLALIDAIRAGAGFTLFDGQPYIWYHGLWYHLAALCGPSANAAVLSAALSVAAAAAFFLFLRRTETLPTAVAGGVLMAAFGPLVNFTSGYGAESFALLLVVLACLLLSSTAHPLAVAAAGLLFGLALASRITFVFAIFLLLPLLAGRARRWLLAAAVAVVLAAVWWHNHEVVAAYPYLFTWDGLATDRASYGIVSTLVPQLHPAVAEATRTLYTQVAPLPLDFFSRGPVAWSNVLFLLLGAGCVVASRRAWLMVATLAPLAYFLLGDATLSTNFYRHYLALFPQLFVGIALACGRLHAVTRQRPTAGRLAWSLPLVVVVLAGVPYLRPQPMLPLEMMTPPPEALPLDRYLVNSGFYHPECLIKRYPDKQFIGLPLDPAQFDDFADHYQQFSAIVWHTQFSVQEPLLRYLTESGRYRVTGSVTSPGGVGYLLLEKAGD